MDCMQYYFRLRVCFQHQIQLWFNVFSFWLVKCTLYACVCKYHNYCPNEIADSLKGNGGKFVVCDSLHWFLYRNVSSNPWTVFYVGTDTVTNAKIVCEYLRMIPFSVVELSNSLLEGSLVIRQLGDNRVGRENENPRKQQCWNLWGWLIVVAFNPGQAMWRT